MDRLTLTLKGYALLAALLMGALCARTLTADFQTGIEAYERGDYAAALRAWRPLAEQGDASAQYNLGWMYDYGEGVREDNVEAVRWYRKATEQGHDWAQYYLGTAYAAGEGVPQDYAEAVNWFRRATEQGHIEAQYALGFMYANGKGVSEDSVEGYAWLSIALAQDSDLETETRRQLIFKMSREQMAAAKEIAREYWAKYVLPFRK